MATAFTYIAIKVGEKIFDKALDFGIEKILPKQKFQERLRVVIQKTADEFDLMMPELKTKLFPFTSSEIIFSEIIEKEIYTSKENLLKVDAFTDNENIIQPDQKQLDLFYELFIVNIKSDTELRKLYVEEYYKETIFKINESINNLGSNINQIVLNTSINPQLTKNVESEKKSMHYFNYRLRNTLFLGRDAEIQNLNDFYYHESNFSWWVITGRGGVGKSRLALEFCIRLELLGVKAGFLSFQQIRTINWNSWSPEIPHFFVIDFAANDYRLVSEFIGILVNYKKQVNIKVLLIEREINDEWWKKLKGDFDCSRSLYNEEPLSIGGLSDDYLIEIVKQISGDKISKIGLKNENLKDIQISIDPFKRPLFSMFIGIALANGKHIRDWNQFELLDFQLDYEYGIVTNKYAIYEENIFYQHKNLLILATICHGLNHLQLDEIFSLNISWLPAKNTLDLELYNSLAGNIDINQMVSSDNHFQPNKNYLIKDPNPYKPTIIDDYPPILLSPLLPDLLGEYFVLKNVESDGRFIYKDKDRLDSIIEITNRLNSYYYLNFTGRILQDFPCHKKVSEFLKDRLAFHTNNRGLNGQLILTLMRGVYFKHPIELEALWKHTENLYEDEKKAPAKAVFIDNPNRVYQDATLLMIYHYSNNLERQLYYHGIMRKISDEYQSKGIFSCIVNRDSIEEIERFTQLLSSGKEIDPSEAEKWYKRNLVSDELVFQLEASAIGHILKSCINIEKELYPYYLLERLYELSCQFTDPRILNTTLQVWIDLGTENISFFEEKIKTIYSRIKATPPQYQPMNIELEKCKFIEIIIRHYLFDINKVNYYFEDLMIHFQMRDPSREIAFAFIEMAKLSFFLCGYYYDLKQFSNGGFYAMRTKRISYIFGPNIPQAIQILLVQIEQKNIEIQKNLKM
ncbi:hypothetical protein [Spirosoma litoris]